ncbi:MAG: type II toxin-antitoxin system RelE/ParE family toxin [Deltaproteobacteria bacterium]|nr:type II toxin-antitoxin system RelE/ParE family toxin [Deltaproteobacteria bacterium]
MAEFVFSQRFLQDVAEWEQQASTNERAALTQVLAAVAADPVLPGRSPSFYDPVVPSYLYRAGPFLVHYRLNPDGSVEFLNLFHRS